MFPFHCEIDPSANSLVKLPALAMLPKGVMCRDFASAHVDLGPCAGRSRVSRHRRTGGASTYLNEEKAAASSSSARTG